MRLRILSLLGAGSLLILLPALAGANARLVSVTPVGDGCVLGPTGVFMESWDVQPELTYELTIDNVFEYANGGTDPTVNVMVMNSNAGNVDLVATQVSTGVYRFQFTASYDFCGTSPILYGNSPGQQETGSIVGRHDTGAYQAHLRFVIFHEGCADHVDYTCFVPAHPTTWGSLKTLYR